MKILSLGWGVQSFTLAAMVALGEFEPVDAVIHADTLHESQLTYEFAARWSGWLTEHGVNVVTVKNPRVDVVHHEYNAVKIPAFTRSDKSDGQIMRQCTSDWKIAPMRRWLQANRNGAPIEMWLGISLDEFQRMKGSDVKYITNRWPLIEKKMTRRDCEAWLTANGIEVPPKSACTFCPFHSTSEWQRIKANPADWSEAVRVDAEIRNIRPPRQLFIHPSRKPIDQVDLRTAEEKGQLSLWDTECSGVCGV